MGKTSKVAVRPEADAARGRLSGRLVIMNQHEEAAHRAWSAGDLVAAFASFRRGANEGHPGCMLDLGYFFDEGLGTARSKHQAMHWYRRAFTCGVLAAATNVALLFRERGGYRKMYRWLQIGGQRGDGDALVEIARCCLDGLGTARSRTMATSYARKALRTGQITPAGRNEAALLAAGRRA